MSNNNCPNCGSDAVQSTPGVLGNNDLRITCLSCRYSYMKPRTKNSADDALSEFQTTDTNKNKFDFKFSPIQVLVVIAIGIISFSVTRNGRNLIKHDHTHPNFLASGQSIGMKVLQTLIFVCRCQENKSVFWNKFPCFGCPLLRVKIGRAHV